MKTKLSEELEKRREEFILKQKELQEQWEKDNAALVGKIENEFTNAIHNAAEVFKSVAPIYRGGFFNGKDIREDLKSMGLTIKRDGLSAELKASHVGAGGGRKELTEDEVMAWFDKQEAGKKFQQQVVCNALGRAGTTVVKKLEKLKEAKKIDFEEKGTSKLWFKL